MKRVIEGEFEEDPRTRLQKMKIEVVKGGSAQKKQKRGNADESNSDDDDDREYLNN
jgi:hypothetical protein